VLTDFNTGYFTWEACKYYALEGQYCTPQYIQLRWVWSSLCF